NVDDIIRLNLLTDVARGLSHMHWLSIIHGDLKASNVVVGSGGRIAKICDFGSSRIVCSCYDGPQDQPGTAQWDSPEVRDDKPRTPKSDIWAFGCVALQAQFDKFPYSVNDLTTYRMQHRGLPPATGDSVDFEFSISSRGIWSIMQRCWKHSPADRPNAYTVFADLEVLKSETRPIAWFRTLPT
ncbi:hypothetical protein FRC07_004790, partial [Ceratobasidium sp. 392]